MALRNLDNSKKLFSLLKKCKKQDRKAQNALFQLGYSYAMSIALRYASDEDTAKNLTHEAFLKIFTQLDKYDEALSFKGWMRRIVINTAIDYFRRERKHLYAVDVHEIEEASEAEDAIAALSAAEIRNYISQLPPVYRTVFNLYVIEGYKHTEIATMLEISVGTSKSNLAKARKKLQHLILQNDVTFTPHERKQV